MHEREACIDADIDISNHDQLISEYKGLED